MSAQTRSVRSVLCGFLARFQLGEGSGLLSDQTGQYKVFQTSALRFFGKDHSSRVVYLIWQKRKLRGVLPTGPVAPYRTFILFSCQKILEPHWFFRFILVRFGYKYPLEAVCSTQSLQCFAC